jgi:hypothetical protein
MLSQVWTSSGSRMQLIGAPATLRARANVAAERSCVSNAAADPAIAGAGRLMVPPTRCTTAAKPRQMSITVHARVCTYEGDVDRLIEEFERQADLVRGLDGFAHAYLLVDRGAAGR